MKKKLLSLIFAIVMVMGLAIPAMADAPSTQAEWAGTYVQVGEGGEEYVNNAVVIIPVSGPVTIKYTLWDENYEVTDDMEFSEGQVYSEKAPFFAGSGSRKLMLFTTDSTDWIEAGYAFYCYGVDYTVPMEKVGEEPDPDPEPKELTAAFAGSGASSSGEYLVAIAGVISGEFPDGTTNLTGTQIQAVSMNIHSVNTVKFDSRTMASSTVNWMKVNVENGKIVSVDIQGRCQTASGSFDTYTLTLNAV